MFNWKFFKKNDAELYFQNLFCKSTQEARLDIYQYYRELDNLSGFEKFKEFISKFKNQLLEIHSDLTYIDTCFSENKKLVDEDLKNKDLHKWVHINSINSNIWYDKLRLVVLEFSKMFDSDCNGRFDLNSNWSIGAYLNHFNKFNMERKYTKIEEFNNKYLKKISDEVNKYRDVFNRVKHNISLPLKEEDGIPYQHLFNFWYICEYFLWSAFESIFSIKGSSITCDRSICADIPIIKSYQYIKDGIDVERYKWKVEDDLIFDREEWKANKRSFYEIYQVSKEKAISVMMNDLNQIMDSKLEKDRERAHILVDVIYKFNKK